jgi:RNA polymerase subunit RPABC4/transcription elongation factor Spt4
MSEKRPHRFQRLEFGSLLKVFRKPRLELKRFECLEIEGHKIQIKISAEAAKNYSLCPKCKKKNPKDSLYCVYCGSIFSQVAEEEKAVEMAPWEKKCPGCGRINNRNQEYCLYCGWRVAPLSKEAEQTEGEVLRQAADEELLMQGEIVTVVVDGKTYCSTDKGIPPEIKKLILKIKKEGYSKEMVDEWVKKINQEKDLRQVIKEQDIAQRENEARSEIAQRFMVIIGIILFYFLLVFSFTCLRRR